MPTLTYPALSRVVPNAYTFGMIANTLKHTSALSGAVRTVSVPGARWRFAAEYRGLSEADLGLLQAFFAALKGSAGRFSAWPMHREWPLGTCRAAGATASAAAILATSFTASGLGANATLRAGDFFAVGGYLYTLTAPTTADGAGGGTLNFGPPLRIAHGNGTALTFYRPTSTFMLMADETAANFRPGRLADVTVDAVEAFP